MDQAKDMLQDGFIKVFNSLERFNHNGSLEGWIRRIMVNTSIDHIRRDKRSLVLSKSEELIDHLVSAMYFNIRGQAPTDGEPKAMLGYCWPSVLSQLLAFRTQEFVGNLLAGIEVVLLEMPDFPPVFLQVRERK